MMRYAGFEDLLQKQAEKIGDHTALIFEDGGIQKCTYREFCTSVRERSRELQQEGRTCTAITADGSFACVREIFAANLAGMQIVLMDPSVRDEMKQKLLVYTDADCVWQNGKTEVCEGGVQDGRGKILFFTSGTTSSSKAVVLSDASLMASAYNGGYMLPLSEEDTLLCLLPLAHVFGFVCGLLWGLSCGAAVALGRGARHYFDDFAYFRPTAVSVVPMLLGYLLRLKTFNEELKLILVGAGDCAKETLEAVTGMGIRVSFGYGLTETSSGVAISVAGDPTAMEICPDDEITLADDGEILIKASTCMMQGYYKMPQDTEAVLREGILHTGDLGRFDEEGKLHITGRKKEILVFSSGTKIFLPEYEAGIREILKDRAFAVIQRNDRAVLVHEGTEEDNSEIMDQLLPFNRKNARTAQISEVIGLGHRLPRTAAGKVQRWVIQKEIDQWQQEKK